MGCFILLLHLRPHFISLYNYGGITCIIYIGDFLVYTHVLESSQRSFAPSGQMGDCFAERDAGFFREEQAAAAGGTWITLVRRWGWGVGREQRTRQGLARVSDILFFFVGWSNGSTLCFSTRTFCLITLVSVASFGFRFLCSEGGDNKSRSNLEETVYMFRGT